MDDFAGKNTFSKLDINVFDWEEGKQNNHPICQGSLKLRPRDFAKFGYLLLNEGRWKDQQIVSGNWISQSIQRHSTVNITDKVYYGYLWWLMEIDNTTVIYSGGGGGQYCFTIPDLNLILSFTGSNFSNQKEYMLFDIVKIFVTNLK